MELTATPVAIPAKSALAEALGCDVSAYQGALVAPRFGELQAEFLAATTGCAVLDQGWRTRLRVTGSDAQRWLNGMVTNTAALDDGQGNYSFLLNAQGRLQGDVYQFRQGDGYVLETSANQKDKLLQWLDHYIIMDDVTLGPDDQLTATLAVAGPDAGKLLAALGQDVAGLTALRLLTGNIAGIAVTIVRDDASCVPFYSLWHDATDSQTLWNALTAAGAVPAGWEAAELLRIASGTPLFGVDLQERDLPQETGQARALHFSKGCYIGQEIVERIHSRGNVHRGWRGFLIDSAPGAADVAAGAPVISDDKTIGTLTSVATLPLATGAVRVGLGIVRTQSLDEHKHITAEGVSLHPTALPFVKN